MYEPEIAEWAQRDMNRKGMEIDEYCNSEGYNVYDILKDSNDDEED